ncbi:MAG: NAD-dependent epimerase/dehydratase family protein [Betaproteobacteria bacterium]|nr:NAD-dependent epimerase/dehydratase family protein [Betaproteobacteria bacterium]
MRRLLIVGYGDMGSRMLPLLRGRYRLYGLARSAGRAAQMRAAGVTPVMGDLDRPESLRRLAGIAQDILHFAPPPSSGTQDSRTVNLVRALARRRTLPQRFIYLSTSGVYGDRQGEVVNEWDRIAPNTERASRRAHAEGQLRDWSKRSKVRVSVLRVPGIYAHDRLPVERLKRGTPSISAEEDSYTNHVHASDLARLVLLALNRGQGGRVYHASDGAWIKAGDYFDAVADALGFARPPRVSMGQATETIPANALSFLQESRRLSNRRAIDELKMVFRYPNVAAALAEVAARNRTGLQTV